VIQKLQDENMDLEEEEDVTGFLGVHIKRNESDGTIKLTQSGLIKHIVDTLNLHSQPRKLSPATPDPLVMDADGDPPDMSQCAQYVHRT
jgi:hypothetical protein